MSTKNKIRESGGVMTFRFFNVLIMTALMLVTLYPFLYIIFASLSNSNDLMKHTGLLLWPLNPTLKSYEAVLQNHSIYTGYMNTLIVLVGGLALQMILTFFGAYVLSRKSWYCVHR